VTTADEPAPPRRIRFDWRILPILGLTGLFMFVLVRQLAGPDAFFEALRAADWSLIVVALVMLALNLLVAAFRWIIILDTLGHRVPMGRALAAMLATWPIAMLTPARASDLLRGVAVRDLAPTFVGAGSVLAEKAIDVQSLCVMTIVGAVLYDIPIAAVLAVVMLIVEWAVILLIVRKRELIGRMPVLRRRPEKVAQLLLAFTGLLERPGRLLLAGVTSLLSWVMSTGMLYTLLVMTHADVAIGPTLALWPAAVFTGMLPVTLAGMGTRDLAFIYLLRVSGWSPIHEGALLASTFGYSILGTVLLALIGIPFTVQFMLRTPRER
jgi:uncharacterized protein (TIRG00374 family)